MSLGAAACSEGTDGDGEGEGGAGGEKPTSHAGSGGDTSAGAAGETSAGGACATDGTGSLSVVVAGLPDGVDPDITLDGPDAQSASSSGVISLGAGNYIVSADPVFDDDPIVRTMYTATVSTPSVCVGEGTQNVKVTYSIVPSSNKLWMATGKDDELAGFASADIAETVMTDASVSIDTPGAGSLAFDKDGNLWAVGPTIGEDMLVRIPAAELGASGTREPDIKIKVPEIECFPFINHIAFDPHGNLWLSACGNELRRLNANDLKTSGEKISDVLFTEVEANQGIAFDGAGNLWVAGPTLERFDAARLDLSDIDAPDLELSIATAKGNQMLGGGEELAFDKAGNLWGVAGSTVFQLASSVLDGRGTKSVKANVSFDIDVLALPGTPAFDDGNGLWLSLADGELGRFSPEQLGSSAEPGTAVAPDLLISSDSISTSLPVALFPAPQGLPLYHSLPAD